MQLCWILLSALSAGLERSILNDDFTGLEISKARREEIQGVNCCRQQIDHTRTHIADRVQSLQTLTFKNTQPNQPPLSRGSFRADASVSAWAAWPPCIRRSQKRRLIPPIIRLQLGLWSPTDYVWALLLTPRGSLTFDFATDSQFNDNISVRVYVNYVFLYPVFLDLHMGCEYSHAHRFD
jgi:hypothetical protein